MRSFTSADLAAVVRMVAEHVCVCVSVCECLFACRIFGIFIVSAVIPHHWSLVIGHWSLVGVVSFLLSLCLVCTCLPSSDALPRDCPELPSLGRERVAPDSASSSNVRSFLSIWPYHFLPVH